MRRVFVSYSWRDANYAHRLANMLLSAGHGVWIDHEGLDLIRPLAPQLRNAIRQADLFIHVRSEHSEASGWVNYERTCAWAFRKPTIEIPTRKLAGCEVRWPRVMQSGISSAACANIWLDSNLYKEQPRTITPVAAVVSSRRCPTQPAHPSLTLII